MNKKDMLKTITFFPDGHHVLHDNSFDNVNVQSTTERLMEYRDHLKKSIDNGIKFTGILNELITTTNVDTLFKSIKSLSNYQLDSAYIIYPQQYSREDFLLIFLGRLLDIHGLEYLLLRFNDRNNELYQEFPGMNNLVYFNFQENPDGSVFYVDRVSNESLFYLNFNKKLLFFNSDTLTNLFIDRLAGDIDKDVLKKFEIQLKSIGKFMYEDYNFDIDLGILDSSNDAIYPIKAVNMPMEALDKLFILSSNLGYMLITGNNNDAILKLSEDVILKVSSQNERWVIQVKDSNNDVSLFDVLNNYDFLRDWYLDNIHDLGIRNNLKNY